MGEPFELKVNPTYIHLKARGGLPIAGDPGRETWSEVGRLCEEEGRAKVLVEAARPEGTLDTMSAFESGRGLAEHAVGLSVAICFHDHRADELTTFLKTVAQNRGVRTEFFSDIGSALRWLDVETGENAAVNH